MRKQNYTTSDLPALINRLVTLFNVSSFRIIETKLSTYHDPHQEDHELT